MPEPIGKEIQCRFTRTAEVVEKATHFSVLDFRVIPHSHEVTAEVCLMDAAGNAVGPAQWVRLNPDKDGKDNWAQIVKMTLTEIGARVKAALQTWEATVGP